jgi:alpha/beta superfamily hydrolase
VSAERRGVRAESIAIPGPAGPLEALVDWPDAEPRAVAVLCHPHPLHEGTMHNKVVATLARTFVHLDAVAVRFNFRGVGASAGSYDDGRGEADDARAAVAYSRARWPGLPLALGGFSFGGAVALDVAAGVAPFVLVAAAPAVARLPSTFAPPPCPWLVVQGDADDVVPTAEVTAFVRAQARPPTHVLLPGVGHYFHRQLGPLGEAARAFLEPLLARIG